MKKTSKDFLKITREYNKLLKQKEKGIAKNYANAYKQLRDDMRVIYDKYALPEGQLTFDSMLKYNRLKKLDKEIFAMMTALYLDNNKLIRETLKEVGNKAFKASTKHIDSKELVAIKKDLKIPVNDRNAGLKWSERQAYNRNDITYKVQRTIKAGLERGDTYTTMTREIKQTLGKDIYKSRQIVRSESRRVYSATTLDTGEQLEKSGIKMDKVWHNLSDERVRSSHQAMDGQRVPVDEVFTLPSGATTLGPGLSGVPEEDINCRCFIELIPRDINTD